MSHVKSFLALLFAIGHIDVWGAMTPLVPGQVAVGEHTKPFQRTAGSIKLSGYL